MAEEPSLRAERLLRDVMGPERFSLLQQHGSLDLPSRLVQGRMYRLDRDGSLLYKDRGEPSFRTTLCVQPTEAIPRDDVVAMRYLLVTCDEERLLKVANPIAFGFFSLARALQHDLAQHYPAATATLMASGLILGFLLALSAEVWILGWLLLRSPALAVLLFLVLLVPGFVGAVLVVAGAVEACYSVRTLLAR